MKRLLRPDQKRTRGAGGYRRPKSRLTYQIQNLKYRVQLNRARDQMAVMTMAMETAELAIVGLLGDAGDEGQAEAALMNMKESMTCDGVQDVLNRVRYAAVHQASRNVALVGDHDPDSEYGKGFDAAADRYDSQLDRIAELMWKGEV